MAHSGHRPVTTHFNRFGSLAFRLAMAMLGDESAAAAAVLDAFSEPPGGSPDQPNWLATLEAVRRNCMAALGDRPAPAIPEITAPETEEESENQEGVLLPPPAHIHAAMAVLSETDRAMLWRTLIGQTAAVGWESLSEALRRLEIAINNQNIPGDGSEPWLE